MSVSQNFTDIRPTLNLNFARSKTLDPRITFERASIGTYVGADGLIKTAAADEARFDHDANGKSLGLLIEEQRINHALYSKDFTTSFTGGWIDNGNLPIGNITENYDVAPDGTLTATKIVNFTGVPKFLRQLPYYSVAYRTTGIHTISLFAKPISTSFCTIRLNVYDGSTDMGTFYDLLTGSISSDYGNPVDNSITPIGNGWYRITHTTNNSGVGDHQIHLENNSECLIWGAQYERGNFATSFISTTTSQVTRQPDNAQITGTNFSSWYNQPEGSYLFNAQTFKNSAGNIYYGESGYGAANRNIMYANTSYGNAILYYIENNNNPVNTLSAGYTFATNTFVKTAYCYKQNDFGVFATGGLSNFDTSGNIHTANSFSIGMNNTNSGEHLNGHIKQLTYYPKRLKNTSLQYLTQ